MKYFTPPPCQARVSVWVLALLTLITYLIFSIGGQGYLHAQVTGSTFRDFNGNGTHDTNEPLMPGIIIRAYNTAGTLCGTDTTSGNTAPNYSVVGCGSADVRIEFIIPTSGRCANDSIDFTALGGANYGSSIQFVKGNSTNVNFALYNPADFNTGANNTMVYVPCYVHGDPLVAGGATGNSEWFVGYPYNNSGTTAPSKKLKGFLIGATWGVAYSRTAKKIFTSAMVKRHIGTGKLGTGGIYIIDETTFVADSLYNLDQNGYRTRAAASAVAYGSGTSYSLSTRTLGGVANTGDSVSYLGIIDVVSGAPEGLGVIGTNAQRGLSSTPTVPTYDPAAFSQIGKIGLGDLEISEDEQYLFVVNLYSRKVLRMKLDNPANPTNFTEIKEYPLPNIPINKGVLRPWALKFFRGKLYIGAVSTGENGGSITINGASDVNAYVFEVTDPTGNFTVASAPLLTYPLNYTKGTAASGASDNRWYPWTNKTSDIIHNGGYNLAYPQPIVSDIEFSDRGDIILSIMDRTGNQLGANNYRYLSTNTEIRYGAIGGDIQVAGLNCKTNTFTLENNGKFKSINNEEYTGGAFNAQGPGGGEFFNADAFSIHSETAMGSLAILKGDGKIMATIIDPDAFLTGGTVKFSTTNASASSNYRLYGDGSIPGTTTATLGKAIGLGDVELSGTFAPIEIGNRIWEDKDKDGLQDASEPALANVKVVLSTSAGVQIDSTITDAKGNYYFSSATGTNTAAAKYGLSLLPNTNYVLNFPTSSGAFFLIPRDQGSSDLIDSDADISGQIAFKTGAVGQNNHSFDVGYTDCKPVIISTTQTTATCNRTVVNKDASITITATGDKYAVGTATTYIAAAAFTGSFSLNNQTQGQSVTFRVFNGSDACYKDTTFHLNINLCPAPPCTNTIGGTVFNDLNNNGIFNTTDSLGFAGIKVYAYNCVGLKIDSATTDYRGRYTFTNVTAANDTIRIEFARVSFPNWASTTNNGIDGRTDIQFVKAPNCMVDLGLVSQADYCQTNPRLATPCYIDGAVSPNATGMNDVLVSFNYNVSTPNKIIDATRTDIGATWGLAYARSTKKMYASAFLKRHVGLKDAKLGAIYVKDYTNPTSAATLWLDVSTLAGITGSWTYLTDAARGLANAGASSLDADAFKKVATVGLGDIEISGDDKTLYVMDLTNRQLLAIDIATKMLIGKYPVPEVCSDATAKPIYYAAGPTTFTATDGKKWLKGSILNTENNGVTYGQTISNPNNATQGTTDAALYATSVYSTDSINYNFPMGNGTYSVKMHFATNTSITNRNTSVKAEGIIVLSGIDVFTAVGVNNAITRSFTATVTDGVLSINTINGSGSVYVTVSGFEITPTSGQKIGITRPFATKYHNGKVYVGAVCDASISQNRDDLTASIFVFDPMTSTYAATPALNIPLTYLRGASVSTGGAKNGSNNRWEPWTSVYPNNTSVPFGIAYLYAAYYDIYTQPVLSDIEFDNNGSMIIAFFDRFPHQIGATSNYRPDRPTSKGLTSNAGVVGGDILRAYFNGSTFELEANGKEGVSTPKPATTGANSLEGPGGGEFYHGDELNGFHYEIITGGLALLPGSSEVRATAGDPLGILSGGVVALNNTTGLKIDANSITLYSGTGGGLQNKSNGLGDLELICNPLPIQIGNRLWIDTNKDGVQDPCKEIAIKNVVVSLYDKNGVFIFKDTTDANGEYYFDATNVIDTIGAAKPNFLGPQPNTQYYIVIGKETYGAGSQFDKTAGSITLSGTKYELTVQNSTTNNGNDQNDSDFTLGAGATPAALQGYPVLLATTPAIGADHTFDAGFKTMCSKPIATINPKTETVCKNGIASAYTATPVSGVAYKWYGPLSNATDTLSTGNLGTAISGATSVTYTPTGAALTTTGTKYYAVVINNTGDTACADTAFVILNVKKPAAGTDQAPTCVGNTPITTATLAATNISGGAWTQAAGNTAGAIITTTSSETSSITGLTTGIYEFIWSTAATCSDTVKITIPNCAATCPTIAQNTSADTTICAGNSISLRANLTGITTEDIKFVYFNTHQTIGAAIYGTPDGILGTVTNAQLTASKTRATLSAAIPAVPASKTYHVYAILANTPADATCRPFGHRHVLTDSSKCSAGCSLLATASATQPTCANNDGSITLTVTGATGVPTYAWSNSTTSKDITGLSAGNYTVTVTDAGCTTTQTVSLNKKNTALSYSLCVGQSYTLTVSDNTLTNIKWQKDGIDIPTATGVSYIASAIGIYTYTSNNVGGCAIGQCCPVQLVAGTCCPVKICLPVTLTKIN